ncbi:Myb-like_DNA-binding domain-containing protein [Hexamita inflata]|uniref:Myb-like_DNA-binding domain-containing protein n=1 Tax=Hexamita inflata TaxID=28002 RepID=A0ABP1HP65_9EUKA
MQSSKYQVWKNEDIAKIIKLVSQYDGCVIHWDKISLQFPGRTPQQCKSFYSNKIKKNSLPNLIQQHNGIENLAVQAINYLLSNIQNENMAKQFCILQLFTQIQEHIKNALENNINYKFDVNILKLIQNIIKTYKQNIMECVQFSQNQQLNQFVNFMNSFDYDKLLQNIDELIAIRRNKF